MIQDERKNSSISRRISGWKPISSGIYLFVCIVAIMLFASCNNSTNKDADYAEENLGTLQALLMSDVTDDDVVFLRIDVYSQTGSVESQTVRVRPDQPIPGGGTATGADVLFTLRPGLYQIIVTPLDKSGKPSSDCARGSANAKVTSGKTTEIVIPLLCDSGGSGILDVTVFLEHQPLITNLIMDPCKYIKTCQKLSIEVTAVDLDQDTLTYTWTVTASPPNSNPVLDGLDNHVTFITKYPGEYEVKVEVKDPQGHTAGLTFPIHVSGNVQNACLPVSENQLVEVAQGLPGFTPESSAVILRERNIKVNTAVLLPPANQYVGLKLFPDTQFQAVGIRIERNGPNGYVWIGNLINEPQSLVTLSLRQNVVAGDIITENGEVYQIRYAGNDVHIVRQIDQASYAMEGEPEIITVEPSPELDPCGGTDTGESIDAMIIYTPAVRTLLGGALNAEALIYLSVANTNQSYLNSQINQRLRIVYVGEVTYTEDPSFVVNRNRLQNPSDGFLDDVLPLRDLHGADVVGLLINNTQYCGYAYILDPVSTAFETYGYCVIHYDCASSNLSLAHEFGHLMGARHDRYVDPTDGSPYDYDHGYINVTDGWRTVMAYNNMCSNQGVNCTRLPYWSNPNVLYGGDPMGIPVGHVDASGNNDAADNHLALNNTAWTVANFRCSSPATSNVWMKDTWDDTGLEPDPNTAGQDMWKSPYIWVRNTQDVTLVHQHEHENPVFGSPNWVYAKLHNGGNIAASGTLEIYYAYASAGLSWPGDWTIVGSAVVNNINAHSTQVVEISWPNLPGTGHYCLLARWVSAQDPMTFPETTNIESNVRNNNNIVWRNVNIVPAGGDATLDATIELLPVSENSINIRIGPPASEINGSFLIYGQVTLTLDYWSFKYWQANGAQGEGIQVQEDQTILITDPAGGTIEGIPPRYGSVIISAVINPNEMQQFVKIHATRPVNTPARTFHLDFMQFEEIWGEGGEAIEMLIGGVTYELKP